MVILYLYQWDGFKEHTGERLTGIVRMRELYVVNEIEDGFGILPRLFLNPLKTNRICFI
jgi:hypothetical protein